MKLRPLIFDFGNVVAFFDYLRFFDRLGTRVGSSGEAVRTELMKHGFAWLHADFEAGKMSPTAFAERVTAPISLSLPLEEFARDWDDIFWLNEPVSRLIAGLKARGHRLVLGSNTNSLHVEHYRRKFAATLDRFDALVLSYEVGCLKPDRRFYEACAQAAGAPAGECVFIDDMAENVQGARTAGLQGVQYVDMPSLAGALRGMGVEVATGEV